MPLLPVYVYRASMLPREKQARLDGDTFWMDLDLGLRQHSFSKIRLHNYSCPERSELGGIEAWQYALGLLFSATAIVVQTHRDQLSHDRWVADIWLDGIPLGPTLQQAGHATYTPM